MNIQRNEIVEYFLALIYLMKAASAVQQRRYRDNVAANKVVDL